MEWNAFVCISFFIPHDLNARNEINFAKEGECWRNLEDYFIQTVVL